MGILGFRDETLQFGWVPHRCCMAVVSSCREMLVLSPATSATPMFSCHQVMLGTLNKLPVISRRKAGMTSSPHGPYAWGCTRATMRQTKGRQLATVRKSQKMSLSSDCGLQLARMKLESLVIAGQRHCGECVPEPCTHRPSSHEREERPKSSLPVPKAKLLIGTKS